MIQSLIDFIRRILRPPIVVESYPSEDDIPEPGSDAFYMYADEE